MGAKAEKRNGRPESVDIEREGIGGRTKNPAGDAAAESQTREIGGTGETGAVEGIEQIAVISGASGELADLIPGPDACTCGKKPGERGRHKKDCPLSVSSGGATSTTSGKSGGSGKKLVGGKSDLSQTKVMVQTLLTMTFNVAAIRAGDHWKLTPQEAENLAEPIASIMNRHDLTKKAGEYGDYIALLAAIGMIIVPKALVHIEVSKAKKGGQANANVRNLRPEQQSSTAGGAVGEAGQAHASGGAIRGGGGNPSHRAAFNKQSLAQVISLT